MIKVLLIVMCLFFVKFSKMVSTFDISANIGHSHIKKHKENSDD